MQNFTIEQMRLYEISKWINFKFLTYIVRHLKSCKALEKGVQESISSFNISNLCIKVAKENLTDFLNGDEYLHDEILLRESSELALINERSATGELEYVVGNVITKELDFIRITEERYTITIEVKHWDWM